MTPGKSAGGLVALLMFTAGALSAAQSPPVRTDGLPSVRQLFTRAKSAATDLPSPLAERELEMIAGHEMVAIPELGLADLTKLYEQVHGWPEPMDTAEQKTRTRLRLAIEEDAIEAYASQGKFEQSLKWLEVYDPGNVHQGWPSSIYSRVMLSMISQHKLALVPDAVRQCMAAGNQFPFAGVTPVIGADALPLEDRLALVRQGLLSAPTAAPGLITAGRFLAQVHTTFPTMDSQTEDAAIALLAMAQTDLEKNPDHARADEEGGPVVLAVLAELDSDRAQQQRGKYPALATGEGEPLLRHLSSSGRPAGLSVGRGGLPAMLDTAARDPGAAVASAVALRDKNERFASLAVLAKAMAHSHPRDAQQAAADAYDLLDKDVAFAEDGAAIDLAEAYIGLDQAARAAEVAGIALAAGQKHAEDANDQFDLDTPEGVAKGVDSTWIPLIGLSYVFNRAAAFFPGNAIAYAEACHCKVIQPLLFSKIAEAMTPAGAKQEY
jgi:hypothetical protein